MVARASLDPGLMALHPFRVACAFRAFAFWLGTCRTCADEGVYSRIFAFVKCDAFGKYAIQRAFIFLSPTGPKELTPFCFTNHGTMERVAEAMPGGSEGAGHANQLPKSQWRPDG